MTLQQIESYKKPKSTKNYYHDFYANKRKLKFTQKTHDFNLIRKATAPDIPITRKEQDVLANISNMILRSPNGIIAITPEEFSELTENKKWQNNIIRKHLSDIIFSKYKKGILINGAYKQKVIVFKFTEKGEEILQNIEGYYSKKTLNIPQSQHIKKSNRPHAPKEIGRPHAPIYKDKKNIKINRSIKSNDLKNNFSKQYDKPKTLAEENLITEEEHYEIVKRSGREFTLNAMNEILKNMIKRGRKAIFNARRAFKAWFALCIKFELRDAVKTSSTDFYIKGNKTKAEIVEYTTLQERERYLNKIEDQAIYSRSDETQLKAKWANVLGPNIGYNLLKNLKYWCIVGSVMEIYLVKRLDLSAYQKETLLNQVKAIGGYQKIQDFKLIVENE